MIVFLRGVFSLLQTTYKQAAETRDALRPLKNILANSKKKFHTL